MRAVRDLRDLVNVSRLSYVDSDDEESNYTAPSVFSFHSSMDFDNSTFFHDQKSPIQHKNNNKLNQRLKEPIHDLSNSNFKSNPKSPMFSATTPIQSFHNLASVSSSSIFNQSETRSSFFKDKSSLFDRSCKPVVNNFGVQSQISLNTKKPLPPLKSLSPLVKKPEENNDYEIQPVVDKKLITPSIPDQHKDSGSSQEENNSKTKNGNFDKMLTYIDASVVSEWLNRANRLLRKMHKWHQDNSNLYDTHKVNRNKSEFIKYESFINFANFWLGCNKTSKLDHRQRRQLLEMEYSIICDEVTQAFQIGIESQEIGLSDIHQLLHAVFKEYPLQLLSFRGVYLLLDYIDTLSSNRLNEYKNLLSDVKCRTVNKQYAQWLLSIRSFSLINLCWSIVKFYRDSTAQIELPKTNNDGSVLDELNGRISSLSVVEKNRSDSTSSSISSNSTDSKPSKSHFINSSETEFVQISNQEKYEFYLKAVLKNDYPEVLHYLITTKKIDPFKIDEKGRTLIFLAVINDLPKILNYLVKRWPTIDINMPCDSGNTPLHAAVNQGNIVLVELLLNSLSSDLSIDLKKQTSSVASFASNSFAEITERKNHILDVNKVNKKCMDTTPLHLAVWNDFNEIAIRLVQSNADPYLKMNGASTSFDLALENDNQVLYELLSEYYQK